MMRKSFVALLLAAGLSGALLPACTQMPTEKSGVADIRPQLSFAVANEGMRGARVLVDGLDMGMVGDYAEGVAALRVLSGTHLIRIELGGRTIAEEKLYVGDGVNRTIVVR